MEHRGRQVLAQPVGMCSDRQVMRRVQAEYGQRLRAGLPQLIGQDGRVGQRMAVDLAGQRVGDGAVGRPQRTRRRAG